MSITGQEMRTSVPTRQDDRDFEIMRNFVRERAAFLYNGPRLARLAMLRSAEEQA